MRSNIEDGQIVSATGVDIVLKVKLTIVVVWVTDMGDETQIQVKSGAQVKF